MANEKRQKAYKSWGKEIDSDENDSLYGVKVKASRFVSCEQMVDWLTQNKVLELVLSENAHPEIVKRSSSILKFLSKHGTSYKESAFDDNTVGLIWLCQLGRHEEMVRTIYTLIQEIAPMLSLQRLDEFFVRIM